MDIEADKGEALVFAGTLMQQVNTEDVTNMAQVQRGMLQRFEKTNEMLINFNQLSFTRYEASVKDFQQHTQLLYDMKKDLDSIFKRIRVLKQRLSKSYPEAFAACNTVIRMEEEEEITVTTSATTPTSTSTALAQPSAQSSGASKKSGDDSGEAAKARIAQPQKPRSKSSGGRKEEGSGGQRVKRTSRSSTEARSSGGSADGSGGQS